MSIDTEIFFNKEKIHHFKSILMKYSFMQKKHNTQSILIHILQICNIFLKSPSIISAIITQKENIYDYKKNVSSQVFPTPKVNTYLTPYKC